MKTIFSVLIVSMLLLSCGNSGRMEQMYSQYDQMATGTKEVEEEVKNAEQKPASFYQHLLENFCERYYDDCFSGRRYHPNSLVIDGTSVISENREDGRVVSWDMSFTGRHSFKGRFVNHNDSPFDAYVYDRGDNSYEITFSIKRYDVFGEEMRDSEKATRTMSYVE